MKNKLISLIERTATGRRLLKDHRFRMILFAVLNMGWNLTYAVFNGILGIVYRSGWFATMFAYYAVLGLLKLNIVTSEKKPSGHRPDSRNMFHRDRPVDSCCDSCPHRGHHNLRRGGQNIQHCGHDQHRDIHFHHCRKDHGECHTGTSARKSGIHHILKDNANFSSLSAS